MDRTKFEARLTSLKTQMEQTIANANALQGAIQECVFWLAALDAEEKAKNA